MGGCSIRPEPKAPISYYYLQPDIALACTSAPIQKTVRLNFVDTTSSLSGQNIVYTKPGLKAGNYLYSKWHQSPNRSISTALYTAFKHNHVFSSILNDNTFVRSELTLDIKVLQFEHQFTDTEDSNGVIVLDAMLYDLETKQLLASHLFRSEVKAKTGNAQGGVEALNTALGKIISELICWSVQYASQH
jgi:cholesterol transport system auxiliary component